MSYVVIRRTLAGVDDTVQICLHELRDDVHVAVQRVRFRGLDVNNPHHILVVQMAQQLQRRGERRESGEKGKVSKERERKRVC